MPPGDEHEADREVRASARRLGTVPGEPHPSGQGLFLAADKESSCPGTASLLRESHGPRAGAGRGAALAFPPSRAVMGGPWKVGPLSHGCGQQKLAQIQISLWVRDNTC